MPRGAALFRHDDARNGVRRRVLAAVAVAVAALVLILLVPFGQGGREGTVIPDEELEDAAATPGAEAGDAAVDVETGE